MDDLSQSNLYTDQQVMRNTQVRIRMRHSVSADAELNDVTGLALSGGGVRYATFNLGLLQAMQRHDAL
jgi:hypothetical protein